MAHIGTLIAGRIIFEENWLRNRKSSSDLLGRTRDILETNQYYVVDCDQGVSTLLAEVTPCNRVYEEEHGIRLLESWPNLVVNSSTQCWPVAAVPLVNVPQLEANWSPEKSS